MSEVRVVAFHPRHLEVMELRKEEDGGLMRMVDAYKYAETLASDSVQAATFVVEGRILFCAGFRQLWAGVYEVWLIPSKFLAQHLWVARLMRRYVDRIFVDFKAHRIQSTTYGDAFHTRWMEFLGFEHEGVLRKYLHNQWDMHIYARVS